METIPLNTECLNKQLALENTKDLDSITSEYKRPTASSLYTEPKTLNLDVNQRKRGLPTENIPLMRIKKEFPTGMSEKLTTQRPVASDFFEYTDTTDSGLETSDMFNRNMGFRMVSENISDVQKETEGQKAVSRDLLNYSDLDQEVESVMETTNKVRGIGGISLT